MAVHSRNTRSAYNTTHFVAPLFAIYNRTLYGEPVDTTRAQIYTRHRCCAVHKLEYNIRYTRRVVFNSCFLGRRRRRRCLRNARKGHVRYRLIMMFCEAREIDSAILRAAYQLGRPRDKCHCIVAG